MYLFINTYILIIYLTYNSYMSYLQRTGNGRNNISWTNTSNNTIKYLHRTGTSRNSIKWSTISTSANILQRTGTSRNNIKWSTLTVKTEQAIKNREFLDRTIELCNSFGGPRRWRTQWNGRYDSTTSANAWNIFDNGVSITGTGGETDNNIGEGLFIIELRSNSIYTMVQELREKYVDKCIWRTSKVRKGNTITEYTGQVYLSSVGSWTFSASSDNVYLCLHFEAGDPNGTSGGEVYGYPKGTAYLYD